MFKSVFFCITVIINKDIGYLLFLPHVVVENQSITKSNVSKYIKFDWKKGLVLSALNTRIWYILIKVAHKSKQFILNKV